MTLLPVSQLKEHMVHQDEQALLAYAVQSGAGAVAVCNLISPRELRSPYFGAFLGLIASRLARSEAVDEASLLHVVVAAKGGIYGSPMDYAVLGDPATGKPKTTSELEDLVARIKERHLLHAVGRAAGALTNIANGNPARLDDEFALPWDTSEAVAQVGQHLLALIAPSAEHEESSIGDAAEQTANERRKQLADGAPIAHTTGHIALNEILGGGFRPGELIVVAGATSMGKTALAIGMACELAERNRRAGIVSLEMPRGEVGDRILARCSRADLRAIRAGVLDDDPDIAGWRGYLHDLDLPVWHPPGGATLAQIAAKAMAWRAKGLSVLVVDHLGWVKVDRAHERLRTDQQIGAVAKGCKQLALALRIPVLLLVQLNREGSKRLDDHRQRERMKPSRNHDGPWWEGVPLPQLTDLKESSEIEQAADVVLFPVRGSELGNPDTSSGCIVVAKQRNGPKGVVPAYWEGHTASYLCDTRRGEL